MVRAVELSQMGCPMDGLGEIGHSRHGYPIEEGTWAVSRVELARFSVDTVGLPC